MENDEKKVNNAEDNEQIEELEEDVKVDEGKKRSEQNKEKLFTQEEVNNIVKSRLYERKKEKQEHQNINEALEKREKAIEERESSVTLRENRVKCCELVNEKGYHKELLEILDTSDPEKFREQAEKLTELYKQRREQPKVYPGVKHSNITPHKNDVRPFADTKHKPKQY